MLDLYAGTGALALEALSRGAERAVLVESSREALAVLRSNIASLGMDERAHVVAADVRTASVRLVERGPFDLVLVDPPWALVDDGGTAGGATATLAILVRNGVLADDGLLVLEHSSRAPAPAIDGLVLFDTRRYGDTALAFYKTGILGAPRADDASPTSE